MEEGKNNGFVAKERSKKYAVPIMPIIEKFSQQQDVKLVYGEPVEMEKKKVIPVAKVKYMGGGGGGLSGGNEEEPAQGGGGGGYISVQPIGVYEITDEKTRFKPIIDLKFLLILLSIFTFGLSTLLLGRLGAKKVKETAKKIRDNVKG